MKRNILGKFFHRKWTSITFLKSGKNIYIYILRGKIKRNSQILFLCLILWILVRNIISMKWTDTHTKIFPNRQIFTIFFIQLPSVIFLRANTYMYDSSKNGWKFMELFITNILLVKLPIHDLISRSGIFLLLPMSPFWKRYIYKA